MNLLQALKFTILQVSLLMNGISRLKLPGLCFGLLDEGNDPDLSCSNTFLHNQSDQYFPCIARMPLKNALRLFKTKITASATQNGHSVARLLEKFQLPAKLYWYQTDWILCALDFYFWFKLDIVKLWLTNIIALDTAWNWHTFSLHISCFILINQDLSRLGIGPRFQILSSWQSVLKYRPCESIPQLKTFSVGSTPT